MGAVFIQISQVLLYLGLPLKALSWAQESLSLLDTAYGDHHPLVASSHCLLGRINHTLGDYEAAIGEFEATRSSTKEAPNLLTQHSVVATPFLVQTLFRLDRIDEARELVQNELPMLSRRIAGDTTYFEAVSAQASAQLAAVEGNLEEAASILRSADGERVRSCGSGHPFRTALLNQLSGVLSAQNDIEQAMSRLNEALDIAHQHQLLAHPETAESYLLMAKVSEQRNDVVDQRRFLTKAYDSLRNTMGDANERVVELSEQLA